MLSKCGRTLGSTSGLPYAVTKWIRTVIARTLPRYYPADRVWRSTTDLRLHLPWKKLSLCFFFHLQSSDSLLPASMRISPIFHISLLKPVVSGSLSASDARADPGPITVDGAPAYQERVLLNSCHQVGRLQYLVDWKGYGPVERYWVPTADVLNPSLMTTFYHARYHAQSGLRRQGEGYCNTLCCN